MTRHQAKRRASQQNRNEFTADYFAHQSVSGKWQVRRREGAGRKPTLIAQ